MRYDNSVKRARNVLFSALFIPLSSPTGWVTEHYSGIKRNEVRYSDSGLTVLVDSSSSPLFYPLDGTKKVGSVAVVGSAAALPRLDKGKVEGDPGNDDYVLRVGLVRPGGYRPSWVERLFAPPWILHLLAFAKDGQGLDKVTFLNVTQTKEPETTPQAKGRWIEDRTVKRLSTPGDLSFSVSLDPPLEVIALWLHADGDDTKSRFDVTLKSVKLTTEP